MRIRKNAKISASLLLHTNSYPHQTHNTLPLCQLNQSPWDVISFSPSHPSSPPLHPNQPLFDDFDTHYNVNVAANWSSLDSVGIIERCDEVEVNGNVDQSIELYEKDDELGFMKGWQCERAMKNANITCDDHIINIQNGAVRATNSKGCQVSGSMTRSPGSRSKKRSVAITNQNEFYYYSGFGPSWGKKRGSTWNNCTNFNACDGITTNCSNIVYEMGSFNGDVVVEDERKRPEHDLKNSWSNEAGPIKEDSDFMKAVEKEKLVVKLKRRGRGRKPIKARSLKSLM